MQPFEILLLRDRLDRIHEDFKDFQMPAVQQILFDNGMMLLSSICAGLTTYIKGNDSYTLHKDLILASMEFNDRWEQWLDNLKPGDLKHAATKAFHEMLLRFSKGAIKAYRGWLIDRAKQ